MPFQWHYKQCPCCKATVPDSVGAVAEGEEGQCGLCKVPRVLLDGPPADWFQLEQTVDSKGRVPKPKSVWMERWRNRPVEERCRHERKLVAVK